MDGPEEQDIRSRFYIFRIGDAQVGLAGPLLAVKPAPGDEVVLEQLHLHGPELLKAQNAVVSGRPQVLKHVTPPEYVICAPDGTEWTGSRILRAETMIMADRGPAHVMAVGVRVRLGFPAVVQEGEGHPK